MSGAPTPDPFSARQLQAIGRLVDARLLAEAAKLRRPLAESARNIRLAITVARDGTYPETGDTFAIRLLDCGFTPKEPGNSTMTCQERTAEDDPEDADDVIAREINDQYVPEGTYVAALWQRGLEGDPDDYGEWWIRYKGPPTCWFFYDNFNDRPFGGTTDLGANWNEVTGDWGSAAWTLVENYATGGGTANAVLLTTQAEPERSAGQMYISIDIYDAQTGDKYYIYPCCPADDTVGPLEVEYECTNAPAYWTVRCDGQEQDFIITEQDGWCQAILCVDNEVGMLKAWMNYGVNEPLWLDDCEPGDGRYSGVGHDNSVGDIGAQLDNYWVGELFLPNGVICYDCVCRCRGYAPQKTLTLTITNATDRAACAEGASCEMVWEWNAGSPRWTGSVTITGPNGVPWTLTFYLTCETEDPEEYAGRNFVLSHDITNACCVLNQELCEGARPLEDESTCEPFHLVFGPYGLTHDDLACYLCYNPDPFHLTGDPEYGYYYVEITL